MLRILEIISIVVLLITFVLLVYHFKKYNNEKLKYLPYFFGFIIISEIFAYGLWHWFELYNVWWYNVYHNVEIIFYLFVFYHYVKKKRFKRFIIYTGVLYEIYFLINYLLLSENYNITQSFPHIVGIFILITAVFVFLLEMFQSDKILYINHYLIFWLSIGLLVYYLAALPYTISGFFTDREEFINVKMMVEIGIIRLIANIFLYCAIIIGVIWSKKPYHT